MIKRLGEEWDSIADYPEKYNARIVEVHDEPDLGYEYNKVILFADLETGKQWFAHDSGCSCPIPFEDVKSEYDMTPFEGHEQEYRDLVYNVTHPEKWY